MRRRAFRPFRIPWRVRFWRILHPWRYRANRRAVNRFMDTYWSEKELVDDRVPCGTFKGLDQQALYSIRYRHSESPQRGWTSLP